MTEIIDDFHGPYRFLSNFWDEGDGVTGEHLFQAMKSVSDMELFLQILNADTPGKAKRLGRKATLPDDWEETKDRIMLAILRIKFKDHPLRSWLADTRTAVLIEGNEWGDRYWGAVRVPQRNLPEWQGNHGVVWYGENMLGKLLMQVRQEIKEGKL